MAFDTPPYQFTGTHRNPPLPMDSRVPMNMIPFDRRWEQIPPWEKKPISALPFWQQQKRREEEGLTENFYDNWPYWLQAPFSGYKRHALGIEAEDEAHAKKLRSGVSGLLESKSEREARLQKEREKAAAEKQRGSQAERRMPPPTVAGMAKKEEDEDDWLDNYFKMLFLRDIAAGMGGDDPPTPPAPRYRGSDAAFVSLPTMTPQPFGGYS